MPGIRFAPSTLAPTRMAAWRRSVIWCETTGIGKQARGKTAMADNKKAGRAAPPGESLFSSLFNVAARGGKSPRVFDCDLIVCHFRGSVKGCGITRRARRKCPLPRDEQEEPSGDEQHRRPRDASWRATVILHFARSACKCMPQFCCAARVSRWTSGVPTFGESSSSCPYPTIRSLLSPARWPDHDTCVGCR